MGWNALIFKHARDKVGDFNSRVWLHIPLGIFNAFLSLIHWSLVLAFAYMFYKYQRNEDAHTIDQAWKDIYGWLVGFIIGSTLLFLLKTYADAIGYLHLLIAP